ncbi:methylenetetrahydrofolate reductase [Agrilactobacillus composti DSM 18527 = JCM 14202]|uniref:Methylenetetrahydrofolate reductase n=1 Tax=Agrilactobacillus composti DSM 18527 = JCM 14202 TaxID=1423734 RepID=A0A0R1XU47_9LACO|nr:bifunctional homocysteine S-methyltransferase/methylenetetrahydrofolate reductase [Agrilactobacillus composti]KRM33141.1 methylenetetrahydrofolate reductase [Agrilactobacillus composti DSM 18527 = JCM 14202]
MGNLAQALQDQVLVADGAMGTLLYSQYGISHDFESLNLTHGGDILQIHQAYIAAGADVIQTNTYAANSIKLSRYGLENKLTAINEAAVSLAHTAKVASERPVYILGTIGGIAGSTDITDPDLLTPAAIDASVRQQVEVLLATKAIDGLLLETYFDLAELKRAIKVVQSLTDLPIVANVTMYEPGVLQGGTTLTQALSELAALGVAAAGANCHLGPYQMNEALEKTQLPLGTPLAVYPNAGLPNMEHGQLIYDGSAAYFRTYAETFRQKGAHLIGGCCGTTPEHIAGLFAGLKSRQPVQPEINVQVRQQQAENQAAVARTHPFLEAVKTKKVPLVELDPPKTLRTDRFLKSAQALAEAGIGAITLSDGSLATTRISNLALAAKLKLEYGITPLVHVTTRDHNLIGLQAEIMGLSMLGLDDVLVITGDPAKVGDLPGATSVYDVHSTELISYFKKYNEGISPTGRKLGKACSFSVGAALNPNVRNLDRIPKTIARKVDAGADYIITQPIFDPQIAVDLAKVVADNDIQVPIFVGVLPLLSYRNARFLHHEVPGIRLSEDTLTRMKAAEADGNEREVGLQIAEELVDVICEHFNGIHITTPMQHAEISGALAQYVKAKNTAKV